MTSGIIWYQLAVSVILFGGGLLAVFKPDAAIFSRRGLLAGPAPLGLIRLIGCGLLIGSVGIAIKSLR